MLTRHFGQEINKLLGVSADQPIIQVIGVFIPKKFEHLRIYLLFSKVHISVLRESYRPYSNTIQNIFHRFYLRGLLVCGTIWTSQKRTSTITQKKKA